MTKYLITSVKLISNFFAWWEEAEKYKLSIIHNLRHNHDDGFT